MEKPAHGVLKSQERSYGTNKTLRDVPKGAVHIEKWCTGCRSNTVLDDGKNYTMLSMTAHWYR